MKIMKIIDKEYYSKNKAAMFGLDARISLAIFVVLSIVTVFIALGMIKKSKSIALTTDIEEIGKAVIQYYMDTGVYPESIAQDTEENKYSLKSSLLLSDTRVGWRGPYIKYENNQTGGDFLVSEKYGDISLLKLNSKENWENLSDIDKVRCTPLAHCDLWVGLKGMKKEEILYLDERIDGISSSDTGKVRYDLVSQDVFYGLGSTVQRADLSLLGSWEVGNWGACSRPCGDGTQTRSVTCSKEYCSDSSKPSTSQSCNAGSCDWVTGTWGACSVKCDGGTQSRSVTCPTSGCDSVTMPASSQSCNTNYCPSPTNTCSSGTLEGGKCWECVYSNNSLCFETFGKLYCKYNGVDISTSNSNYKKGVFVETVTVMVTSYAFKICKASAVSLSCPEGYTLSEGKCI